MSSCPCGHVLSVDDRFCAKCGLSGSGAPAAPSDSDKMPAGDNDLLLLSPTPVESVETSSVVHSSFPTRWAVVGVLVVAAMMWGLYSWPQAEATAGSEDAAAAPQGSDLVPESDLAEAVEDETDDRPEQAGDVEDEPITDERNGDVDVLVESDSDGESDEDRAAEADPASESASPLVGELTGLSLVVGSFNQGRPNLLSLDTGEVLELKGVSGRPIGMIGSHLVVAQWQSILTVDLASEDLQPTTVYESEFDSVDNASIDGGMIWATVSDPDGPPMLVGLSVSGEVVERREVLGFNAYIGKLSVGDLLYSDAGGVYRRRGAEYERLSTGRLRAIGEEIALVDECDDSLRCTSVWYERESWEPAELPSPGFVHLGWTAIAGNDRWLATADISGNSVDLIDVATGEVERTIAEAFVGPSLSIPVSDDGRWLFNRTPTGASVVIDMDSGTEWPIEVSLNPDAVVGIIDLSGITLGGS